MRHRVAARASSGRSCLRRSTSALVVGSRPSAEVLRVVAMPAEQLDPGYGSELVVQQNAYDWVDLVGGFV